MQAQCRREQVCATGTAAACFPLTSSCRALRQGPLLASLSSYRFVAHSFAPILTLVCAEEAARAGLSVAGSPLVQGATPLA